MSLKSLLGRSVGLLLDVPLRFSPFSDLAIRRILQQGHAREQLVSRLFADNPDAREFLIELCRETNPRFTRALRLAEAEKELAELAEFVDLDTDIERRRQDAFDAASRVPDVEKVICDIVCPDDEVLLKDARLRVPQRRDVAVLIQEILVNQDYYFATDEQAPRILDCGSHFGLAIYYFKHLYPEARITAFEPVPKNRDLLLENVRRNDWKDVEVLPCAISDSNEPATFFASENCSMAGSLTERAVKSSTQIEEIEVPCRRLSEFLDEPVHFLKLDIEGVEDRVLAEAEPKLSNIQHIFCEYHDGEGLDRCRLAKILTLLDRVGFDTHTSKAWATARRSGEKPIEYVAEPLSMCIWGKARKWPN